MLHECQHYQTSDHATHPEILETSSLITAFDAYTDGAMQLSQLHTIMLSSAKWLQANTAKAGHMFRLVTSIVDVPAIQENTDMFDPLISCRTRHAATFWQPNSIDVQLTVY